MAEVRITHNDKEYLVSKDGIYRLEDLSKVSLSKTDKEVIEEIKAHEQEILVSLFVNDTSVRSHKDVAKDLGVTDHKVKMMRYQFTAEQRKPYSSRLNILKSYYAPPLLK